MAARAARSWRRISPASTHALAHLSRSENPGSGDQPAGPRRRRLRPRRRNSCSNVTALMLAGRGDDIPVSLMPADGTFPSGTSGLRKTQYRRRSAGLGNRSLHPVRPMQLSSARISVIRARYYYDAHALNDPAPAPQVQIGAGQCARLSRHALHLAILCRGLHRLRLLRRSLPGASARASPTSRRSTLPPNRRCSKAERENIAFFEHLPVNDRARSISPMCAASSFWSRCSNSPAPAPAAARRPICSLLSQLFGDRAADRQRHRLLVDLWRQSAGHALDQESRRTRPRLVEFAVRG